MSVYSVRRQLTALSVRHLSMSVQSDTSYLCCLSVTCPCLFSPTSAVCAVYLSHVHVYSARRQLSVPSIHHLSLSVQSDASCLRCLSVTCPCLFSLTLVVCAVCPSPVHVRSVRHQLSVLSIRHLSPSIQSDASCLCRLSITCPCLFSPTPVVCAVCPSPVRVCSVRRQLSVPSIRRLSLSIQSDASCLRCLSVTGPCLCSVRRQLSALSIRHRSVSVQSDASCLRCLSATCSMLSHVRCLATRFLANDDQMLPVDGRCPCCDKRLLWGDLIRYKAGCYQRQSQVSYKAGCYQHQSQVSYKASCYQRRSKVSYKAGCYQRR